MRGAPFPRRRSALRLIATFIAIALVATAAGVFVFSGRAAEVFSWLPLRQDFRTALSELDAAIAAGGTPSSGKLAAMLDRAEKRALSVESGLSVLKRRRALASRFPEFRSPYVAASIRLATRFPHAESAAAVAAEALLAAGELTSAASYAARLTDPRFLPIKTAILIESKALSDAGSLTAEAETALLAASQVYASSDPSASSALAVDAAIVLLLTGDGKAALDVARERVGTSPVDAGGSAASFLAELEYDFGDASVAAALFSMKDGVASALRRADAATLASDYVTAREAWKTVVSSSTDPTIAGIALYDLAATSSVAGLTGQDEARDEEAAYLERLLALDAGHAAGAVRLARLYPGKRGDAVLDRASAKRGDGLIDLERIRRASADAGPGKTIAALWLLMNRRGDDVRIPRWAAYYMETYGAVKDLQVVLATAKRKGIDEPWLDFHEALGAARAGKLDDAERGFSRAANTEGDWRLAADLAVVSEAQRSMKTALERYEIAASIALDPPSRAELQLRIARCLEALGKENEARRVLAYALELDPENRTARLALKRLNSR